MYEHNALGYWSGLTLCLTKVRSSRARCPATALIVGQFSVFFRPVTQRMFVRMHTIGLLQIFRPIRFYFAYRTEEYGGKDRISTDVIKPSTHYKIRYS